MNESSVAVLGAGPIGLEAALYARACDFPVTVYEAGAVGEHVRRWHQVRLFTPWRMNTSPLGRRRLLETDTWTETPNLDVCPTGEALVSRYLEPLAALPELAPAVRPGCRIAGISRGDQLKGEAIGAPERGGPRFRLLVDGPGGERVDEADIVLDATGVFGQANALGAGGIPAPGERDAAGRILTGLPDVAGRDLEAVRDRDVLVVGGGLSAATTICALAEAPVRSVTWATRAGSPPLAEIPGDSLPARLDLVRRANALAADEGVRHLGEASVREIREHAGTLRVELSVGAETVSWEGDRIIAQTGFRPDLSITRELQVHHCWASEAPMRLAAALLGAEGGDCMTQTSHGADSLRNPEPDFFVLGAKSYGRNSRFLLSIGREQIRDAFRLITGDASLDRYAGEAAHVA